MQIKKFYEHWSGEEINSYIDEFNILVLFQTQSSSIEARIVIYGKLSDTQKEQLLERITTLFGGMNLSDSLCNKINEYAEKWYNKFVLKRQARVLNFGRRYR